MGMGAGREARCASGMRVAAFTARRAQRRPPMPRLTCYGTAEILLALGASKPEQVRRARRFAGQSRTPRDAVARHFCDLCSVLCVGCLFGPSHRIRNALAYSRRAVARPRCAAQSASRQHRGARAGAAHPRVAPGDGGSSSLIRPRPHHGHPERPLAINLLEVVRPRTCDQSPGWVGGARS